MEIKSEFINVIVPQRNSKLACVFKYLQFIGKEFKTCDRGTKIGEINLKLEYPWSA